MAEPVVDPDVLQEIINELEEASFFRYAKPEDVATLKHEMVECRWPFPMGCGRDFPADAEDLSEQGVAAFFGKIRPLLTQVGVELRSLSEEIDEQEDGYTMIVNGERHQMCDAEELNVFSWAIVSANAFALIDKLLKRAHAEERAYCYYFGGNDQIAIFITPRQLDILKRWPLDERSQPLSSDQMLKQAG